MEGALSKVQEALSELLEQSTPEPEMIWRLQAVDAITQTADSLAWVLAAMAQYHPAVPEADLIRTKVGMKDVGDRLAGAVSDPSVAPPEKKKSTSTSQGEVSWL